VNVIQFQRRPAPGQVSIERVFAQVRNAMPADVRCEVQTSPCLSRSVVWRVANLYQAARSTADINHITGDVHYLALALEGRRTLLTIHDCVSLDRLRGLKRAIFRWLWYVLPVRHVAMVSVVSESARRELLRHTNCDASKVRTIHNCVGEEFVPVPKTFNESEPLLLQVGTGATKNIERVIPALAGLRCRLKIVGKLTAEQLRLVKDCNIRYTSLPQATDAELLQSYRECDLVLFASTYEGFGLPIVEANATGRPVVTSHLLSMPEVAGEAACLVDPFDCASIRSSVLRIMRDAGYRSSLIEAGFENVKRFTPKRIAAQYAALYEEIMDAQIG
jgi:glycosyltransferase involved in cell wall biosynthesis